MQFHSPSSAREFLQTFLGDASNQRMLREALGGEGGFPTPSTSGAHGRLDQLARKLARGELTIVAVHSPFAQPITGGRSGVEEYRIVSRRHVMRFPTHAAARTFLQPFLSDPSNRPAFRRALGGSGVVRVPSQRGDHELLDQLARQLVRGERTVVAMPKRLQQPISAPPTEAGEDRAMTPREAEQAARAAGPTLRPTPPTPAPLLPLLEEVQIEGAKVLPEVWETLEQIDLTMGTLDLAGVSLEPAPSGVAPISEGMQQASATITATIDSL